MRFCKASVGQNKILRVDSNCAFKVDSNITLRVNKNNKSASRVDNNHASEFYGDDRPSKVDFPSIRSYNSFVLSRLDEVPSHNFGTNASSSLDPV